MKEANELCMRARHASRISGLTMTSDLSLIVASWPSPAPLVANQVLAPAIHMTVLQAVQLRLLVTLAWPHLPSPSWDFEDQVGLHQFDFNYSLDLLLVPDCHHHPLGSVALCSLTCVTFVKLLNLILLDLHPLYQSFHCQDHECSGSIPKI